MHRDIHWLSQVEKCYTFAAALLQLLPDFEPKIWDLFSLEILTQKDFFLVQYMNKSPYKNEKEENLVG